jgi:hypothetical protein
VHEVRRGPDPGTVGGIASDVRVATGSLRAWATARSALTRRGTVLARVTPVARRAAVLASDGPRDARAPLSFLEMRGDRAVAVAARTGDGGGRGGVARIPRIRGPRGNEKDPRPAGIVMSSGGGTRTPDTRIMIPLL